MATSRATTPRKTASKTPRPDGSPPDGKASQTRRKILDAAAATFAARGFQTAKLNEIAALASMKGGSLYFHFESKDVLIREVLREGVSRALEHVRTAVESLGPDADICSRLQAAVNAHLYALHTMATYTAAVLGTNEGISEETRKDFLEYERLYARYWDSLVAQAQTAGYFVADSSPRSIRRLLFGAMNATGTQKGARVDIAVQGRLVIALFHLNSASKDDTVNRPRY